MLISNVVLVSNAVIKMADYLITMDSGEQFLAHHGVQGMKWGEWNPETAARYARGERSNRTVKLTDKAVKYREKANQHKAVRDNSKNSMMTAKGRTNKYRNKSDRAAQGAELFRNANQDRADRFDRKADKQEAIYDRSANKMANHGKKYAKNDKKATRYEVKAYKSDANDAGGWADPKTVRDLKKHRISMDEAKQRTQDKVDEVLRTAKNPSLKRDLEQVVNLYKKDPYKAMRYEHNPIAKELSEKPAVAKARKDYLDTLKEESRFGNLSKKEREKWVVKAADKFYNEEGKGYGYTKEQARNWFLYDDGDQGSSFKLYLESKIKDPKERSAYVRKQIKAKDNYDKTVNETINQTLGKDGNRILKHRKSIFDDSSGYADRSLSSAMKWAVDSVLDDEEYERKAYYRYD